MARRSQFHAGSISHWVESCRNRRIASSSATGVRQFSVPIIREGRLANGSVEKRSLISISLRLRLSGRGSVSDEDTPSYRDRQPAGARSRVHCGTAGVRERFFTAPSARGPNAVKIWRCSLKPFRQRCNRFENYRVWDAGCGRSGLGRDRLGGIRGRRRSGIQVER